MTNYYRMNKILEEEKTCEKAVADELVFCETEADRFIREMENQSEEDAGWQWEWYK